MPSGCHVVPTSIRHLKANHLGVCVRNSQLTGRSSVAIIVSSLTVDSKTREGRVPIMSTSAFSVVFLAAIALLLVASPCYGRPLTGKEFCSIPRMTGIMPLMIAV